MRAARRGALIGLVLLLLAGTAWVTRARRLLRDTESAARPHDPAAGRRAPEGVRIRVQVLNTTRTRGLARRATRLLRDHGFDVVDVGTSGPPRDTTLVLDRSDHPAWAQAAAALLGPAARVEARPDSSRYLDVTVLLGAAWRPPAEPLDP